MGTQFQSRGNIVDTNTGPGAPGGSSTSAGTTGSGTSELDKMNEARASVGLPPLDYLPGQEPTDFNEKDFWQNSVIDVITGDIKDVAKKYDMDVGYLLGWFGGQRNSLIQWLQTTALDTSGSGEQIDPNTPEGMYRLVDKARTWVGMYFPGFRDAIVDPTSAGGRGRGSTRPTAAQLRAQFDMQQLADVVNQMSQALLLENAKDAKSIANAYVNSYVANPDQKLDFETFVRGRLLNKPRAKLIYQNKPDAMSEEQYLQPYVQAAMQRIGPGYGDQMANVAIGGARLAASPQQFQERLNRTHQVTSSSPFMQKLSDNLGEIKQVLR